MPFHRLFTALWKGIFAGSKGFQKKIQIFRKKVLTKVGGGGIMNKLSRTTAPQSGPTREKRTETSESFEKSSKNLLTNGTRCGKIKTSASEGSDFEN